MFFVGKKALVFAGRSHHYLRLIGLVNHLRQSGAAVRFLAVDNSWNIDPATAEYLIPNREDFVHILDHITESDFTQVTRDTETTLKESGPDRWVGGHVWAYSAREVAECRIGFERVLDSEQPDLILILHENNFWTKLLAHLVRRRGIKVVSFQEGLLRLRDQATQNKQSLAAEESDLLLIWSEAARTHYLAAGVEETKLRVTGIMHLDEWVTLDTPARLAAKQFARASLGITSSSKVVLFSLPQTNRYEGDLNAALQNVVTWSEQTMTGLILRFHPFERRMAEQFRVPSPKFQVVDKTADPILSLLAADVVLSQHSTIAVEALALGVPLVEVDFDHVGVLESLADQGVAIAVDDLTIVQKILTGEIKPPDGGDWLANNLGPLDGRATERAAKCIWRLFQ